MTISYHLKHAVEVYGPEGPTGEFSEVVRGEVRDYGDNALFAGTADECVEERAKYRIPTRLVATETRPAPGPVAGADHTWDY